MQDNTFFPLFYSFHFYLFGIIAIASALAFVTRKSPVAAALWLINTMFCLAALYVLMDAQFMAAMQVLVYAGAIMVVFLFVVMLLNLGRKDDLSDIRNQKWRLTAGAVAALLLAEVMTLAKGRTEYALTLPVPATQDAANGTGGVIGPIAEPLFKEYLLAFELTSVLLLAAIVGAVVLGRKKEGADAR